jgi:hypothetical protein
MCRKQREKSEPFSSKPESLCKLNSNGHHGALVTKKIINDINHSKLETG